ncbi:MAG: ABC transporter permease [bacterium]
MTLTLRMAWRNLWRHKRRTWLTAMAMIFSNVLLVFMISLQFGSYDLMINNTLQAFSGYLQVQHPDYNDQPRMRSSIANVIPLADEVRSAIPDARVGARGMAFALASSDERSLGIQLAGVQPAFEPGVSSIPGLLKTGRYLQEAAAAEVVVGSILARNLKISIGDEITLLGSGRDGSFAAGVVNVVGIFESGISDLDRGFAQVPLRYLQDTFAFGDHGHAIVISLASLDRVAQTRGSVETLLTGRPDITVLDWDQLQPGLRQAIQADLSSAWFMYGVLVILVAFSVLNTQLMSVLERTREFGVITALGIRPRRLAGLVMTETVLMACIGLFIGVFLGWLLAVYLNVVGFTYPGMAEMAEKFNLPDRIHPSITLLSMLLGPLVVFLFSLLAAIYPAVRLLRLQPVEAMRAV